MSYSPHITCWEHLLNGKVIKRDNVACFYSTVYSSYDINKPQSIKFLCEIDERLNKDMVDFYLQFLGTILNKDLFNWKEVKRQEKILFFLNCADLTKYEALMYLSAFRYLQEFPEIVVKLFESKEKKLGKIFVDFIKAHWDYSQGNLGEKKYNSMEGHGLHYIYAPKPSGLTLKDFKRNLENGKNICSVHAFFKTNKPPKPIKPPKIYELPEKRLEEIW